MSVGDLVDGLGLFRDPKKPHRPTGGASSSGAPSGTRTPVPLIKSLYERESGAVIEVDFSETRGRRTTSRDLTPHLGSATREARESMASLAVANVIARAQGEALVSPVSAHE